MGLNADLGWPQGIMANVLEKKTFIVGRSLKLSSCGTLRSRPTFSLKFFKPYPSAVIQRGGRVGLFSLPHGKHVAYKSYI